MPPKKEESTMFKEHEHFNHTLGMLVVLILLSYLAARFAWSSYYSGLLDLFGSSTSGLLAWLRALWQPWKTFAVALTGLGLAVWGYSAWKLRAIKALEEAIFGLVGAADLADHAAGTAKSPVNEKWVRVLSLMNSANPSDWRLAIIEADVMLDELLRAQEYHGDTVGDMLKSIEPSDMTTLDNAWEAHKVRNRIAHSGTDFELNSRETKRVIALFESVFKEFEII